jgi:hypothetical protein
MEAPANKDDISLLLRKQWNHLGVKTTLAGHHRIHGTTRIRKKTLADNHNSTRALQVCNYPDKKNQLITSAEPPGHKDNIN